MHEPFPPWCKEFDADIGGEADISPEIMEGLQPEVVGGRWWVEGGGKQ
jgi:hypothetical protein